MPWTARPTRLTLQCNGEQLRYFRQRSGQTQEELAHTASVSVRAVAKAEAGGRMHADTLEKLADALCASDQMVHPEDLINQPRQKALQFFRSYAIHERQLVARCHDLLSEELTTHMAGDPAQIPFSGQFAGIDGMDRMWKAFFGTIMRPNKRLALRPGLMIVEGNHVMSIAQEIADLPGMPSIGPQTIATHLRFERGQIVHFETHFDTLAAAREIRAWRGVQSELPEGGSECEPANFTEG